MKQFDEILKQIDGIAKDSGYKGVNLLGGKDQELKVVFNEDRSSSLTVKGDDASAEGLGLEASDGKWAKSKEETLKTFAAKDTSYAAGDYIKLSDGKIYEITDTIAAGSDGSELTEDAIKAKATVTDYTETSTGSGKIKITTIDKDAIGKSITQVEDAVSQLRNMASVFGNNYSIVENREEFTENLINVLEEGADKLTLADMNEESANMLALQTRQQLAINSLSLASQAAQSVLSLF